MSVLDMMTPEQRERSKESMAMTLCQQVRFPMGSHVQQLTGHFHQVVNLPVMTAPICPSVTTRLRRGMLLLEEVIETFAAMGLDLCIKKYQLPTTDGNVVSVAAYLTLEHIEGSRYDVVETADGLSDINVIVAGTAVEFGIPLHVTDYEVYSSNLTKVREDGTPIINGVTKGYRVSDGSQVEGFDDHPDAGIWCDIRDPDEPGYDPTKPIGKILKPEGFVKANIPAALVAFERQEF